MHNSRKNNKDLVDYSPQRRQNTQENDSSQKRFILRNFGETDSSIIQEGHYSRQQHRQQVQTNSPRIVYQRTDDGSTEFYNMRDYGHLQSVNFQEQTLKLNQNPSCESLKFQSVDRKQSKEFLHQLNQENRSQRSMNSFGRVGNNSKETYLAEQLQNHTEQAALIAAKAILVQQQMKRVGRGRSSHSLVQSASLKTNESQKSLKKSCRSKKKEPAYMNATKVSKQKEVAVNKSFEAMYAKPNYNFQYHRQNETEPIITPGRRSTTKSSSNIKSHKNTSRYANPYLSETQNKKQQSQPNYHQVRRSKKSRVQSKGSNSREKSFMRPIHNMKESKVNNTVLEPQILQQSQSNKNNLHYNCQNTISEPYISNNMDAEGYARDWNTESPEPEPPASELKIRNQRQVDEFFMHKHLRSTSQPDVLSPPKNSGSQQWIHDLSRQKDREAAEYEQKRRRLAMGHQHLIESGTKPKHHYSSVNRGSLENTQNTNTQEFRNELEVSQKKERVNKGNSYLASAGRINSRNGPKMGAKIAQTDDIDELQHQLREKRQQLGNNYLLSAGRASGCRKNTRNIMGSPNQGQSSITFANKGDTTNKKSSGFNDITFEYSNTFDNRQLRNPVSREQHINSPQGQIGKLPNKSESQPKKTINLKKLESAHENQMKEMKEQIGKNERIDLTEKYNSYEAKQASLEKVFENKYSKKPVQNPEIDIEKQQKDQKVKEMQKKLRFLHQKLGAVMKAYKTRRIYQNNKTIRKIRVEFRELIQFAYILKQDIVAVQNKKNGTSQIQHIQQLLSTSLRDIVQKRMQFARYFQKMLDGAADKESTGQMSQRSRSTGNANSTTSFGVKSSNTAWIHESGPRFIQQLNPLETQSSLMRNSAEQNFDMTVGKCHQPSRSSKSCGHQKKEKFSNSKQLKQFITKKDSNQPVQKTCIDLLTSDVKSQSSAGGKDDRRSQSSASKNYRSMTASATKRMRNRKDSEQIKSKVLNPEDRRMKVQNQIYKMQNTNTAEAPAYTSTATTESVRKVKTPAVMTFGNSIDAGSNGIDEAILNAKHIENEPAVTITGPLENSKTQSSNLKIKGFEESIAQYTKVNHITSSNQKPAISPVRQFKCDISNPVLKNHQITIYSDNESPEKQVPSKTPEKDENEKQQPIKRDYLRKHSNSRSVMYDHKKSILMEKLEKSQNLEKPTYRSSGYNQTSVMHKKRYPMQQTSQMEKSAPISRDNYQSMKTSVMQSPEKPAIIPSSLARKEPANQTFVSKIPRLTRSIDRESSGPRDLLSVIATKQDSPIKVYERSLNGAKKQSKQEKEEECKRLSEMIRNSNQSYIQEKLNKSKPKSTVYSHMRAKSIAKSQIHNTSIETRELNDCDQHPVSSPMFAEDKCTKFDAPDGKSESSEEMSALERFRQGREIPDYTNKYYQPKRVSKVAKTTAASIERQENYRKQAPDSFNSVEASPEPQQLTIQKQYGNLSKPMVISSPPKNKREKVALKPNESQQQSPSAFDNSQMARLLMYSVDGQQFDNKIDMFDPNQRCLDLGMSSNFNSYSNQMSRRSHNQSKQKHGQAAKSFCRESDSSMNPASDSTFRLQPCVVQDFNEEVKSPASQLELIHINFADPSSPLLNPHARIVESPGKCSSIRKSKKKQKSPNKENEGSPIKKPSKAVVRQELKTFCKPQTGAAAERRRRSKADRKTNSRQSSTDGSKMPFKNAQNRANIVRNRTPQEFRSIDRENNTHFSVVQQKSASKGNLCSPSPSKNAFTLRQVASASSRRNSGSCCRSSSASKISNLARNNLLKPVLQSQYQPRGTMSPSPALSHSQSKTQLSQPQPSNMAQTLQQIQQMLVSLEQQQQQEEQSPNTKRHMRFMVNGLQQQVGQILQTQMSKGNMLISDHNQGMR